MPPARAIWLTPVPAGLKPQAWHLFAIFVATIIGLILQPLPLGAMALISIVFTVISGVLTTGQALLNYSNSAIWLITGAFFFAKGLIKTGLARRIAFALMRLIGDSTLKIGYAMVFSDLIIAPATPSNSARAGGVLFPVVRGLCSAFDSEPGPTARRFGAFLIQTVFQGNAITSAMFLTSMAANPLAAAMAAQALGIEITWGLWAGAAVVPGLASLLAVPYILYRIYPPELKATPQAKRYAADELVKMGPMPAAEKTVAVIFLAALMLWATAPYTKLDATIIALLGVAAMLMTRVLEWRDIIEEKGAWDTLIWAGALIGLADFLLKTGFIPWFAKLVSTGVSGVHWVLALFLLVTVYLYAHYGFASLTAHVTAMYAAFVTVAVAAGAPAYLVALLLGYASSLCANLTHYATGPAPIYFGAGYVDQATWWRLGFIISVVNLVIWGVLGTAWWKLIGLW